MTIVAWDGSWLSCDSRVTVYVRDKETKERRRKGHRSNANKITIYGTPKEDNILYFQDQVIVATARCGSVATTMMMTEVLEAGRDIQDVFNKRIKRSRMKDCRAGALFILTDVSAWVFRFSPVNGVIVKEIGTNKFAMGTDARTTMFLMKQFSLDAMNSAAAATLMSKKSGGDIKTIRRHKTNPKLGRRVYATETKDKTNLRMQIRNAIAMLAMDD